jgi:hypothetical protein
VTCRHKEVMPGGDFFEAEGSPEFCAQARGWFYGLRADIAQARRTASRIAAFDARHSEILRRRDAAHCRRDAAQAELLRTSSELRALNEERLKASL